MILKPKLFYDPSSTESVSDRKIFGGKPTSIFELNKIKYPAFYSLWKTMMHNTWFPEEVNMNPDKKIYERILSENEKICYNRALAQLIFMDSLQTHQLTDNLNPYVTAPELNLCLVRQAFEESLHSQSYAVMVDGISDQSDEIYQLWRSDLHLKTKNDAIAKAYETFRDEPTPENFVFSCCANQVLEGVYFYCGFAYFYALAKNDKMLASSKMIRFIHRDELTHTALFAKIVQTLRKEPDTSKLFQSKELLDRIGKLLESAYDVESSWGAYITQNSLLGFTNESIKNYVKYLVNQRAKALRVDLPFEDVRNPFKWIDEFASFNETRANFFESSVNNYSKGSLDWDDF